MFNNVCFEAYRLETFRESSFFNSKSKCTAKKVNKITIFILNKGHTLTICVNLIINIF